MNAFSEKITALERRIAALEANPGASLRYCEVTDVDKSGHARVKLLDGDDMVSFPLRTLHKRTLKDKDQNLPDQGEHVACLFSGQGLESGVVLGAMYSEVNEADGEDAHFGYYRYEDGTTIYYDREAHKLYALIKGEADITVEKDVKVLAKQNADVTVEQNATVKITGETLLEGKGNVTVKSMAMLILEGHAGVRMRGPSIIFEGIQGGACNAEINADLKVKGLVDHKGNLIHSGDTQQSGSQQTSGDITAGGTVTGNPVEGCRH